MSSEHQELIVVKKQVAHEEGHHGGAWKIAFADFMTAMMAFFLVLWIISATDKKTKTVIARYFNPIKLEEPAKARKGIHGETAQTPKMEIEDAPEGDASGYTISDKKDDRPFPKPPAPEPSPTAPTKDTPSDASNQPTVATPANPQPTIAESKLFSDPYGSLDSILAAEQAPLTPDSIVARSDVDPFKDPFLAMPRGASDQPTPAAREASGAPTPTPTPTEAASPTPTPSPSAPERAPHAGPATKIADAREARASRLLTELRRQISLIPGSGDGPKIDVAATGEGLLITLTDHLDFSMFPVGSAEPQARLIEEMSIIAKLLQTRSEPIVVRGHTDGRPFKSATYDNWRLSTARAQMAYYMLRRGGLPDARFDRVEGYADHQLKTPADPNAPENRRIEILLKDDGR